jgi:N-acetylglucosaminyldiphosphoundecaprenol N-acetyl-beta-D-mannosaminyltransferase
MLQTNAVQRCAPRKKIVVGVGISATDYNEVLDIIDGWIVSRRAWARDPQERCAPSGRYICVTSVHGVISSVLDPAIRQVINNADIVTPDGMPLVWALRSFGVRGQTRVYGPNLMLAACRRAAELGHRIFLYGGHGETLDLLERNLLAQFPGLQIAGRYSPPFRPLTAEESTDVRRMITDCQADVIFVGLSTPKQEQWMAQYRELLPGVVLVGVGAAFNFHAGTVKQAPSWMQRKGLEWLFRLFAEPQRLWKRYLLVTPLFLPLWAMQKVRILRYPE